MTTDKKPALATRLVTEFRCTGPACEDTCCAGWIIEVDKPTHKKYQKKHDLVDAALPCGESYAMLCDKPLGTCLQNRDGLCGIQQRYGEEYLSDTCYFYPRSLRRMGAQVMVSASISCPEIARMVLYENAMFSRSPYELGRKMALDTNYLPDTLTEDAALAVHLPIQKALEDESLTAEQHMLRLIGLCDALENAEHGAWTALVETHLNAPPPTLPQGNADDALRLLHKLLGIAVADAAQYRPRLYQTIRDMEKALETPLHWTKAALDYTPEGLHAAQSVADSWRVHGKGFDTVLRNWLAAYVSTRVFPFAGLGATPMEEMRVCSLYFATVKLALMCACYRENQPVAPNETIRIAQSIARLYDHALKATDFFNDADPASWQTTAGLSALVAW